MLGEFIEGPKREPDMVVGPFWFFYLEGLVVHPSNDTAARISIRDGRVFIEDQDHGAMDMGDLMAMAYMEWLLDHGGLSVHVKTDSK